MQWLIGLICRSNDVALAKPAVYEPFLTSDGDQFLTGDGDAFTVRS